MSPSEKAYDEIVNLFARGSTTQQIVEFHPSQQSQDRARELLRKLKRDELSEDEAVELERLGQLEHMMQLIKARARALPLR